MNMNTVILYVVDPEGKKPGDVGQVRKFAGQMNGIYNLFHFDFVVEEYPGTLNREADGRYSVKKMQNAILQAMNKGWLFFIIFTCPVNKINSQEFSAILNNLRRLKKAGVRVWFENTNGIQPVLNDVAHMFARINDSIPAPEVDLEKLENVGKGLYQQGNEAAGKGNLPLAEALYNRALVIQRKLVLANRSRYIDGLAPICQELGTILLRTRRFQPAENLYKQALEITEDAVKKSGGKPTADMAGTHNNLGILYLTQEKTDEAKSQFEQALEIYEPLLRDGTLDNDRNRLANVRLAVTDTRGNLANLLNRQKKRDESVKLYETALSELKTFMEDMPENSALKSRYTTLSTSLAAIHMQANEVDTALNLFAENDKIFEALIADNKETYEPQMAQNFYNEFQAFRINKQPDKAKEYWDKAREICDRYPDNAVCKRLVDVMNVERDAAAKRQTQAAEEQAKRAEEMMVAHNLQAAANAFRAAATLYHGLPGVENQLKSSDLYHKLGILLWNAGNVSQAEICFTNEVAICRAVAENDKEHQPELAAALFHLGRFQDEAKDQPDNDSLKEALKIAEACRDSSDIAQEIWENLSDGAFDLDDREMTGETGETSGETEEMTGETGEMTEETEETPEEEENPEA